MGQRTIRYRAKDRADGRWVFGIPYRTELGNWMMRDRGNAVYSIEESTIGQCIGRKDGNGIDIHEGDRIRFGNDNPVFMVIYDSDYAAFMMVPDAPGFRFRIRFDQADSRTYKVIGNIHEDQLLQ